jgi:O-antigen/teichoic acid export membrane protein
MIIAIIMLILSLLLLWVLKTANNVSLAAITWVLVGLFLISTVSVCVASPQMHKRFSINIIEYLVKINDDGSMSTTKQTTQTVLKKQQQNSTNGRTRQ